MRTKILITFFFLFFPFLSRGEVSLSISPQKLDIVLFPGQTYQGKFKITNHSELFLSISIKVVPFGAKEETGEMIFEKIEENSPVFWLSLEEKEIILAPKETQRIKFKIEVPKEAAPGGYYLFVYFEPRFQKEYFEKSGPKVIPIIGVPILISTTEISLEGNLKNQLEILSFSIPEKERIRFLENSLKFVYDNIKLSLAAMGMAMATEESKILVTKKTPQSFLLTLKNNDIFHLRISGKIFVLNSLGEKIGEGELKEQTILPGKRRNFEVRLYEKTDFSFRQILSFFFLGKNKAKLELKIKSPIQGEIILTEKEVSLTFYSLNSVYFGFGFAIMILLAILARKRIWLFFKVLFQIK